MKKIFAAIAAQIASFFSVPENKKTQNENPEITVANEEPLPETSRKTHIEKKRLVNVTPSGKKAVFVSQKGNVRVAKIVTADEDFVVVRRGKLKFSIDREELVLLPA